MIKEKSFIIKKIIINVFLFILALIVIYPLFWAVINSLKTNTELFTDSVALPKKLLFSNYTQAWEQGLSQYFFNSIYVSFISIAMTLVLGSLAAYSFARFQFKGKNKLFLIIVGALMLAPEVALIPLFKILQIIDLYNTRWAMIVPYIAFRVPFAVFLIRSYIVSIPNDMEEAAYIDGCNSFQVFLKVILPVSMPIIATAAIMTAVSVWNEFSFALVFVENKAITTIPVGLMAFRDALATNWTVLIAGIVMSSIPMIVLFLLLQKYFIRGLTDGGVKG